MDHDRLIFKLFRAPGDVLVLTNLLRDFHTAYKNIQIDTITPYPEITYLNPNLTRLPKDQYIPVIDLTNIDFNKYRKRNIHYSSSFINYMVENTIYTDVCQTNIIPELFLSDEEKDRDYVLNKYNIEGNYWLINAGIKSDITLKGYPPFYWNEVICKLKKKDIQVIQIGSTKDIHPDFVGIKSLVGKTENLRDYFSLCYHAFGHIGVVSLQMHVMGAFRKPCVIVGGGRENPIWEMYPNHTYLHSVGKLDCCYDDGCWFRHRKECINMVGKISYPKCMMYIYPQEIVDSVVKYMEGLNGHV